MLVLNFWGLPHLSRVSPKPETNNIFFLLNQDEFLLLLVLNSNNKGFLKVLTQETTVKYVPLFVVFLHVYLFNKCFSLPGILLEGIGSFLDGMFGTGNGTTSTSVNVGVVGITKVSNLLSLMS